VVPALAVSPSLVTPTALPASSYTTSASGFAGAEGPVDRAKPLHRVALTRGRLWPERRLRRQCTGTLGTLVHWYTASEGLGCRVQGLGFRIQVQPVRERGSPLAPRQHVGPAVHSAEAREPLRQLTEAVEGVNVRAAGVEARQPVAAQLEFKIKVESSMSRSA
jgi:hypothetical protein